MGSLLFKSIIWRLAVQLHLVVDLIFLPVHTSFQHWGGGGGGKEWNERKINTVSQNCDQNGFKKSK